MRARWALCGLNVSRRPVILVLRGLGGAAPPLFHPIENCRQRQCLLSADGKGELNDHDGRNAARQAMTLKCPLAGSGGGNSI
jgi:hypothetical protein